MQQCALMDVGFFVEAGGACCQMPAVQGLEGPPAWNRALPAWRRGSRAGWIEAAGNLQSKLPLGWGPRMGLEELPVESSGYRANDYPE